MLSTQHDVRGKSTRRARQHQQRHKHSQEAATRRLSHAASTVNTYRKGLTVVRDTTREESSEHAELPDDPRLRLPTTRIDGGSDGRCLGVRVAFTSCEVMVSNQKRAGLRKQKHGKSRSGGLNRRRAALRIYRTHEAAVAGWPAGRACCLAAMHTRRGRAHKQRQQQQQQNLAKSCVAVC
ncbi:hypothetical protein IE81DRAFT_55330 [Ceraceosorus guamensis]|uniref:Uncharacterized protein n=1 Tax=Ceraceosorus guamensis TaxID=1522189 RepID=A0A316W8H3_9BASI|nr:hypothetical protein IE81DRAFT_55330 [Ceraceosorus guamensis]PWN43985.1 hypothetical protein IE81DRAFT_55330 [Ceraceosorus guamensis]